MLGKQTEPVAPGLRRSAVLATLATILAGVLGAGAGPAAAADLPPAPPQPAAPSMSEWEFQATFYGWTTALNGDVGVRNLPTVPVDASISDVLKNLDGALMGSFFANNGQWLFLADLVLAKLSHGGNADVAGGLHYDAELTQTIFTGAVGYMLPTGRSDLDFAVTAGVRYLRLKGELTVDPDLPGPPTLSGSQTQDWIDPTVGFFAHWEINEKWFVNAIADVGGFGVGSKLSSTGYLGVGYMWTDSFSTSLGYRYLYEDYEGDGAKTGTFRYNTTMHGPTIAFAWRF